MLLVMILVAVDLMLCGAAIAKPTPTPIGWVVLGFGVLILLLSIGGPHLHLF